MSGISTWADREVQLACQRENPDYQEGEFDYGCACYQSALKAFESVVSDGHSGASVQYTRWILNRLLQCKPLTPIAFTFQSVDICNDCDEWLSVQMDKRRISCFKLITQLIFVKEK